MESDVQKKEKFLVRVQNFGMFFHVECDRAQDADYIRRAVDFYSKFDIAICTMRGALKQMEEVESK